MTDMNETADETSRQRRGIDISTIPEGGLHAPAHARGGLEDVHPTEWNAAVAWLYEPTATMREVGEEFGRSPAWVAQEVARYRRRSP